ncbi:MAG: hypothetical protein JWL85_463 [Candidatus Saccharibacteria bacterium]|nr:hypothetical protein [Candidatus Saccharibacteria bacterium]
MAAVALVGCTNDKADSQGGCEVFRVYAQNRWAPLGTAVREEPDVLSPKLDPSFAPNEVIAVNGWVETGEPVYPTNPSPWNSGKWYRVANRKGWVSFAGVRGEPTAPDPTGGFSKEGGQPAPLSPDCEVSIRSTSD